MPHCALTKRVREYIFLQLPERHETMLDTDVIDRIRHIFLQTRPHVSISQATALLGWTRRQMSAAIDAGDVELWTTPVGKLVPSDGDDVQGARDLAAACDRRSARRRRRWHPPAG